MRLNRVNPYGQITKQTYHFISWTQIFFSLRCGANLLYRIQKFTENLF